MPKMDQWTMELADYNITSVYIKASNSILADTISRVRMLDIYKDPVEDPKRPHVSEIQQVMEINTNKIHTMDSNILCAEQK